MESLRARCLRAPRESSVGTRPPAFRANFGECSKTRGKFKSARSRTHWPALRHPRALTTWICLSRMRPMQARSSTSTNSVLAGLRANRNLGRRAVNLTGNAQTADLGVPEPRPPVELPILPVNALYKVDFRRPDDRSHPLSECPTTRPESRSTLVRTSTGPEAAAKDPAPAHAKAVSDAPDASATSARTLRPNAFALTANLRR